MSTPTNYFLRSKKTAPDSVTGRTNDSQQKIADFQLLEEGDDMEKWEEIPEAPKDFSLPADVELSEDNRAFFNYVRDKMSLEISLHFYLPHGTGPKQRNFVVRTLFAFSTWRTRHQYNASADAVDNIIAASSLSSNSNRSADSPFDVEYGKMQSLCSALVYIARNRNRWPAARRGQHKVYLRIDDSHDFFPFS